MRVKLIIQSDLPSAVAYQKQKEDCNISIDFENIGGITFDTHTAVLRRLSQIAQLLTEDINKK